MAAGAVGLSTHGLRLTEAPLAAPVLGWPLRRGEGSGSQAVGTGASGLCSRDAGCCGHREPEREVMPTGQGVELREAWGPQQRDFKTQEERVRLRSLAHISALHQPGLKHPPALRLEGCSAALCGVAGKVFLTDPTLDPPGTAAPSQACSRFVLWWMLVAFRALGESSWPHEAGWRQPGNAMP